MLSRFWLRAGKVLSSGILVRSGDVITALNKVLLCNTSLVSAAITEGSLLCS